MGRKVFFDIEANGLEPDTIWCIVCKDVDTKEVFTFRSPYEVNTFFKSWAEKEVDIWIGHNIIDYDIPVLNRLLDINIPVSKCEDTLVMSRLFDVLRPFEKLSNGQPSQHSLEAWGIRLGLPKVQNDQWDTYTPLMVERCTQDVEMTEATYYALKKEGKEFSEMCIRLEHNVAYINHLQTLRGFKINFPLLMDLKNQLDPREQEILKQMLEVFPPLPKPEKKGEVFKPKVKKDGTLSTVGLRGFDLSTITGGEFTKIKWVEFNPKSPPQKVEWLNRMGWKPYIFNTKRDEAGNEINTSPKVCEENLATLPPDCPLGGKLFIEYQQLVGYQGKVKDILNGYNEKDGRVHGSIIHVGASTHRQSHNTPNLANIPSADSPYGETFRKIFTVENEEEWCLVGCDASGIQLRMLGHYLNDKTFIDTLLNGDIHIFMASIYTGLEESMVSKAMRSVGKTLTYAICFGAGAQRAASIFGISLSEGQEMIDRLNTRIPGLAILKVEGRKAAQKGYTKGVDGRILPVRGSHLFLPALLQGGEQSVMKLAKLLWFNKLKEKGIEVFNGKNYDTYQAAVVGDVHDEWQTECRKEVADIVGETQVWSIKEAGKILNLNCPLDGEYKIGTTWADTH